MVSVSTVAIPPKLYHYTSAATARIIESSQMGLPGRWLYLTPQSNLNPVNAGIVLALPAGHTAEAFFEIDTNGLDPALLVSGNTSVVGNVNGRAGGGIEYVYNGVISPAYFVRMR